MTQENEPELLRGEWNSLDSTTRHVGSPAAYVSITSVSLGILCIGIGLYCDNWRWPSRLVESLILVGNPRLLTLEARLAVIFYFLAGVVFPIFGLVFGLRARRFKLGLIGTWISIAMMLASFCIYVGSTTNLLHEMLGTIGG